MFSVGNRKMRALVVDDDRFVREMIRDILESENFVVLEAENGQMANETLKQCNFEIDLIVTDILMPDEDGIQFLFEVRKTWLTIGRKPTVIAISGGGVLANPSVYLESARMLGANFTLAKPFSDIDLVEALKRVGLIANEP